MESPLHDFFDTLQGQPERLGYAVRFCYGGDSALALRELNWAFADGYVQFFRINKEVEENLEAFEIGDLLRHSAVLPLSNEILDAVFIRLTDKGLKRME